ncbi:MAG: hypothetical protein U0637_04550 [Phycisphaerales bacterium]
MPTLTAPAKLNLLLSVGAPEPAGTPKAGWHRILSWFTCIDLADTVHAEALPGGSSSRYEVAWAGDAPRQETVDWPPEKDLAVRAHRALEAQTGRTLPTLLRVQKRIPTGAGMGGGSSDAAAALQAVNTAHDLGLSPDELRRVGATLGSDVPFFIDDEPGSTPRPAIVGGFGESVERTPGLTGEVILIIPPFRCATPAVYSAFDTLLAEEQRADEHKRVLTEQKGPARQWGPREQLVTGRVHRMLEAGAPDSHLLFNDLAKPAFQVEPRLGELSRSLSKITRLDAHLTGSGSCLFLIPPPHRTDWVMERAARVAAGCTVYPARLQ